MVMPFLEGATVRDTVRTMPGPPDEAWILGLLAPLLDALVMLHSSQIYHRDIAPDNVLLMADTGRPLLLDFGAPRHRRHDAGAHGHPQAGLCAGGAVRRHARPEAGPMDRRLRTRRGGALDDHGQDAAALGRPAVRRPLRAAGAKRGRWRAG